MGSIRARLAEAVPGRGWLLLAACYLASCWATIVTRVQWGPDSRLYLAWAYRYLGYSPATAAARTRDFLYPMDGVGTSTQFWPADAAHSFFTGSDGAVVGARPLYPLLSAPFVALFGGNGMLVVPCIAYAFVVAGVALLAHRLWGRPWGLLAGLLIMLPVQVSRWALMGQTEGLAIGLTVACLLFLPLGRPADPAGGAAGSNRRANLWFALLLVASLCVRQFALALTAGVALAWLVVALRDRRLRNPWLAPAGVAVGVTVLVLAVQSVVTSTWFGGGSLDLTGRYQTLTCQALHHCGVASIPWGLRYIGRADYGYVRADLPLLATVLLFVVALVWRRRSELTALAVGAVLATLALNLVVVWPSYYRYFAPVHPLILLAALALVADFVAGRRPARSTETDRVPVWSGRPGAGVSRAGLVLLALTFCGTAFVVWRRDRPPAGTALVGVSFVLLAVAVWLLVRLVAARSGGTAGVLAGLTLALSGAVLGRALGSWHEAVLLAVAAGMLVLLPTGGDQAPAGGSPAVRLAGFGVLAAVAVAVTPAGLALAAGPVAGWLAAWVGGRRPRNAWAPWAAVAAAVGVVAAAVRLGTGSLAGHPGPVVHLVAADFRALAVDRVAYLAVLLAIVAVPARWRRPETWYLAGVVLVAGVIQLGHPSTGFLAGYPAALLLVAGLLTDWLAAAPAGAAGIVPAPTPLATIPAPAGESTPIPAPAGSLVSGTPTTATPHS